MDAAAPTFEERQWLLATLPGAFVVAVCVAMVPALLWIAVRVGRAVVWGLMVVLVALLLAVSAFVVSQRLALHVRGGVLQVRQGRRRVDLPAADIVAVEVVEAWQWSSVVTGRSRAEVGWSRRAGVRDLSPEWFGPLWAPLEVPARDVFSVAGTAMVRIATRDREFWIRSARPSQLEDVLRRSRAMAMAGLNP